MRGTEMPRTPASARPPEWPPLAARTQERPAHKEWRGWAKATNGKVRHHGRRAARDWKMDCASRGRQRVRWFQSSRSSPWTSRKRSPGSRTSRASSSRSSATACSVACDAAKQNQSAWYPWSASRHTSADLDSRRSSSQRRWWASSPSAGRTDDSDHSETSRIARERRPTCSPASAANDGSTPSRRVTAAALPPWSPVSRNVAPVRTVPSS